MANMTVDRIKQLLINMHQLKSMLLGKQTNTSKYSNISDYELKINDNQQWNEMKWNEMKYLFNDTKHNIK